MRCIISSFTTQDDKKQRETTQMMACNLFICLFFNYNVLFQLDFVRIKDVEDGAAAAGGVGSKVVVIETKGNCRFRYGIKQEIRVDQKPLNNSGKQ